MEYHVAILIRGLDLNPSSRVVEGVGLVSIGDAGMDLGSIERIHLINTVDDFLDPFLLSIDEGLGMSGASDPTKPKP